jgi:hypothetical protein
MTYLRQLVRTELVALGWLTACAVVFAIWVSVTYLADASAPLSYRSSQGVLLGLYFFAFGLVPILIFGAPTYAWLMQRKWATWWSALLVGFLPGTIILPLDLSIAVYALVSGGVISLLTHLVIGRGANNSFKPKPLRGSA